MVSKFGHEQLILLSRLEEKWMLGEFHFTFIVASSSALSVLADDGDICVTLAQGQGGTPQDHNQRQWHDSWQVVAAAAYCDAILADIEAFKVEDYEAYSSTGFR